VLNSPGGPAADEPGQQRNAPHHAPVYQMAQAAVGGETRRIAQGKDVGGAGGKHVGILDAEVQAARAHGRVDVGGVSPARDAPDRGPRDAAVGDAEARLPQDLADFRARREPCQQIERARVDDEGLGVPGRRRGPVNDADRHASTAQEQGCGQAGRAGADDEHVA
jgi:hypothetical protein